MKTESGYRNDYDFVERHGVPEEIVVTITLCEYRDLVEDRVRLEAEIDRRDGQIEALKAEVEKLKAMLAENEKKSRELLAAYNAQIHRSEHWEKVLDAEHAKKVGECDAASSATYVPQTALKEDTCR